MNYRVTNSYRDSSMTSLVGYVVTDYNSLVEQFGEPILGSGDGKVSAEWIIRFSDGLVATVYDWKLPETPKGIYEWHIGGKNSVVVGRVAGLLGLGNNSWSTNR